MMVRLSFILALFATTVASAPIYQPAFHGPLPGREHEFNLQHVRHVDEQGKVTYIHDTRDHRPDFCAMPGEEELCRQQIEAANNAPAVFDNDTIILTTPHKDDELAPGNDALARETTSLDVPQQQTSDVHAGDTTITLDNGNVITIHNENGHVRNINDGSINMEGPPAEGGHIPNINPHPQSMHRETIKEDIIPDLINVQHQRNINDNPAPVDGPASEGGHFPNINPQQGQSVSENTSANTPSDIPQSPFPGAFGPHTIASHPINKLQEAIRKTQ